MDIEIGTVILHLPQDPFTESSINMIEKFVADRGDGFTRAGFPAMRYYDCTTVQDEDLSLNKIRFDVAIQAVVPNFDGYNLLDGYGIVIDDIIGIHVSHDTGILTLSIKDLFEDNVFLTLVTKVQINVFLKKGGWKNQILTIDSSQIAGLLS